MRALLEGARPFDRVLGVNCYYPPGFDGESVVGWTERPWSILKAAPQLRSSVHLELAREGVRLLGERLALIEPVPYEDIRGASFYETFLDRRRWPDFMRAGRTAAAAALASMGGP